MATDRQAEIATSVAALQDLGPGYDQALAEGLVERIGAEIDKRIADEIDSRVKAEVDTRVLAQLELGRDLVDDGVLKCERRRWRG